MKKFTCLLFLTFCLSYVGLFAQAPNCTVLATPISCDASISASNVGATNNFVNGDYGCHVSGNSYAAGEQIYSFTLSNPADVKIRLVGAGRNLDVFVFENDCTPTNCIEKGVNASSSETLEFAANASTYYIVVDGADAISEMDFRLRVQCESQIGGGNNSNFSCDDALPLACGNTYNFTNVGYTNLLNRIDYGSCVNGIPLPFSGYDGNDRVFQINAPADLELVINMTNLTSDLDMFLFDFCTGTNLLGCLGRSIQSDDSDEEIIFPASNTAETYYLVVDGYSAQQLSNFDLEIECRIPCLDQIDRDCDQLSFFYAGGNTYNFSVPNNLPLGTWTATNSSGSTFTIGVGRAISRNFNYAGIYNICYTYQDANGCDVSCCRPISFGGNPYDCDAISQDYNPYDDEWILSLAGVANADVLYWRNDDTEELIASNTNTLVLPEPAAGQCYNISVYFKDPATGVYQVCCLELCEGDACIGTPLNLSCPSTDDPVCGCDGNQYQNSCYARRAGVLAWVNRPCTPQIDADCEDLNFSFLSALRYSFGVPSEFPNGNWIATGGGYGSQVFTLGNSNDIIVRFPSAGTYTVCFQYVENGQNKECCRTLSVLADPYECRDLRRTVQGSTTTIFIPGVAAEDILSWRNDSTNEELATSTASITVPIPAPGTCGNYSVLFYDPSCDCFRVCCIQVCTQEGEEVTECAEVQNPTLNCLEDEGFNYSFSLKNNSGLRDLTADITILTSIGPTFENCSNLATITGINEEARISLDLLECIVPIQSGMEVTYKITLNNTAGTWFCELDPTTITLPSCEETPAPTCEAACVGTDLVKNGDFEGGYWAFTSDLDPNCYCSTAAYCISTDAANKCSDWSSLTADGKFMSVQTDSDATTTNTIWAQDVMVTAGKNYSFTFDLYANITGDTLLPNLELWIDDALVHANASGDFDRWMTINSNWIASATETLSISIRQSISGGNFGIDNIQFTECNEATGDPLQDLAWLQPFVGDSMVRISQCIFKDELLYEIMENCRLIDVPVAYYDCSGNAICSFSRGANTCPEGFRPECNVLQACEAALVNESFATQPNKGHTILTNYPNPFRNSTTIAFYLTTNAQATLSVFDTNGRQVFVKTATFDAGENQVVLDRSQLSGGVYYYRLETATESITKTMLMLE